MATNHVPMLIALAAGFAVVPLASADATGVSTQAVLQAAARPTATNDAAQFVVNDDKRPAVSSKPEPALTSPDSLVRPCVRSGDRVTC